MGLDKSSIQLWMAIYKPYGLSASWFKSTTTINKKYRTKNRNSFRDRGIRDILVNPIYCIADKDAKKSKKDNYMMVFAAIRELEKIEMIHLTD